MLTLFRSTIGVLLVPALLTGCSSRSAAPAGTTWISAAAVLLAIAATCVVTIGRASAVYLAVSIASGLLALAAVVNAFTADATLWPSEFWRYAWAALNAVGVLAALGAAAAWAKWRGNS